MQTLRKKTSPLKYKNETSRFLGEGVSFKAKLIGILEVSEARGDRMCQEALSDLKVAIRAAGEHKQRITINIAIDGLRLRDEKNGDCLYHHPVHKISFIAQDMTDSRAFGYIFGSPDTGHRFFGIKTDKAASQVVIAMRDLFQVVFALKKKEIELAKQSLDKSHYVCSLFTENSSPSKATSSQDSKKSTEKRSIATEAKSNLAVADLVDLELELNSLQQGLTQMERITPSDPFGSKDDPFGDSFTQYKHPILLPPPPGKEKSTRHSESVTSRTSIGTPTSQEKTNSVDFDQSIDWPKVSVNSSLDVFEEVTPSPPPLQPKATDEKRHEILKQEILSQFHVFTELDPLGTGKSKPYVDKKHFFQELKNPPKTVLNDLVGASKDTEKASLCQDPFGEDPFKEDPFSESQFMKDPFNTDDIDVKLDNKSSLVMNFGGDSNSFLRNILKSEPQSNNNNNNNSSGIFSRQNTFDVDFSKLDEEQPSGKSISFDMPTATESTQIVPPPLPPKRQMGSHFNKPPPRPPPEVLGDYSNASYDSSDIYKSPAELREVKIAVTPVDLESEKIKVGLSPPAANPMTTSLQNLNNAFKQLTLSNLTELAEKLNIPSSKLNNMTLAQLADYLTAVTNEKRQNSSEDVSFKADFASNFVEKGNEDGDNYDKYAVFRDILQEELDQKVESKSEVNVNVEKDVIENKSEDDDRYAALRNITPEIASNGKKEDEEEEKTSNMFDSKEAKELFKIEPPPVKDQPIKSPQGPSLTVTIKNNKSFTSGSLSDAASGSSPENTNFSEQDKTNNDFAGSWAIFDSPKVHSDENKEKVGIQSEEGASPWSSDSKEFGIGTPPEWKQSIDSSNGEEHLSKKHRRRKYGDKWGNFDEPQSQYYPTRRNQSEDPRYYYERHHRFHHTKCPRPIDHSVDHSSSSRDVSPEEAADEDMRIPINHRDGGKQVRCRSGKYPFEKHWCRKYTDSWDEEDDYEYEEEESKPCNWKEHAHYTRDLDRSSSVEQDKSWTKNWPEQRKFRRRCESEEGSKKCCVDWRLETEGKHGPHYGSARFPPSESGRRRYEKKHEPEPNWEEYRYNSGSIYGTHKRNWKRPSSTSELEQKIHTLRPKTGGSDGERERRFKNTRRSRSRDSQYSEKYKQSAPVPPTVTSKRPSFQKPEKFDLPPVNQERPQSGSFRRNKRDEPIIEAKREKEEFPKRSPSVETRTVEINKGQGFEDDFTLDKIAKTPEREGIGVIREESVTDEFPEDAREVGRLMAVHKKNRNRARMGNTLKFDVNNLKKSESVNIFEQENDPFDDDFFSENADIFMTNDQDQEWSKFDDT